MFIDRKLSDAVRHYKIDTSTTYIYMPTLAGKTIEEQKPYTTSLRYNNST